MRLPAGIETGKETVVSKRIAVVGAGQAGLQMSLGLQAKGYDVTLLSNRTAEQIRSGKVMSSQCMFDTALQTERDLQLNWWEHGCPPIEGIGVALTVPNGTREREFDWSARLPRPAQSVDQRIKMSAWMDEFARRGGDLRILDVGIAELEVLSTTHDLVLLAAGKGEIVSRFERDGARSPFEAPQRALALTYVHGMTPKEPFSRVSFNLIPGVGEYFAFPALTLSGPCEIMVFEAIPGGPMDIWAEARTPQEHLKISKRIVREYLPWEAERCARIELTDDGGCISGRFTPTVRKPVLTLPSGRKVFGMADAVVVNDPITGQGANNAAKCCKTYMDAIVARGDGPFDEVWMNETFETYWSYAKYVVDWTNSLLTPPPAYVVDMLAAASRSPTLARAISSGFDDPREFYPWWSNAERNRAFVARHLAEVA
ncbi:2-polyprenyl-6-methoxyphenol hydroxylase [Burkholderia sp. OK233]|nr:2-polyprenyl-6-methoxyphenol hydroxylase [Burkholderia sp. OK233]